MNRDSDTRSSDQRIYRSPLREQQAEETRQRILAAFAEQATDESLNDFSIERVAKRAGISKATVYLHFPNREALYDALLKWVETRLGVADIPLPAEKLAERVLTSFQAFEESETFVRAGLSARVSRNFHLVGRGRRRQLVEDAVRGISDDLSEADIRKATSVLHYLIGSSAWSSIKDESGLNSVEAGEAVAWAVQTLVEQLKREASQGKGGKTDG